MYVYNGYGTAFDGASSWSFAHYFPRNLIFGNFPRNVIFGVNKCLSSHTGNRENNSLVLGEGSTDDINSSAGTAEKKFSINFGKGKTNFLLKFTLQLRK